MPLDGQALREIEEQTVDLAWRAGAVLLDHFQTPLHVEYKGKREGSAPVTEVDRRVEEFLHEELARRFPEHAVVGEEGAGAGSHAATLTWAIDPLDGTMNFLNGLPIFASSIGLMEEGRPVVGAVFLPWPGRAPGRVLHARRDGGAWEGDVPLRVAPGESPAPGRAVVLPWSRSGRYQPQGALRSNPGERRSVYSSAYEIALAADGTFQYALFATPHIWDVAAGVVLVREAGGEVLTRQRGGPGWRPFLAVESDDADGPPGQEALRSWVEPILVGNPDMVRYVSEHLASDSL